jgi:hypothetical protein
LAQSQTVMPLILDYRECSKIKSSFCDPLACNLRELVFGKADAGTPGQVGASGVGSPERDGLFRSEVIGRQKYFQLNREYPLFDEVRTTRVVIADNGKMRGLLANVDVKTLVAGLSAPVFEPTIPTHDPHVLTTSQGLRQPPGVT